MKEKIKTILINLNLFKFTKKALLILRRNESQKILKDELKYCSDKIPYNDFNNLCFSIRMIIHGLEKQLVKHIEVINPSVVSYLLKEVQILLDNYKNYPTDGDLIVETFGIIDAIVDNTKNNEEILNMSNDFKLKNNLINIKYNKIVISKKHKEDFKWINYDKFVKSRNSIREFKDSIVDFNIVKDIVKLAQICPSECNRQTCKVYYTNKKNTLDSFKPDPFVSKDIQNFLIVTVNKSMYSTTELLQPWIDGGIFVESLIMAIHSRGLASCPFQQIKNTKKYLEIKKIASIPANEDIVALIGFGELKDEYLMIETHRKDVSEVLIKY